MYIFFDLDDTLYDRCVPFIRGYELFAEQKGITERPSAEKLAEIQKACVKRGNEVFPAAQRGEITMEEMYIARFTAGFADCGLQLEPEDALLLQACYQKMQDEISLDPFAERVLDLCGSYAEHVGILTNGPAHHQAKKIKALDLGRWIDEELIVISGAVGVDKPDRKIYEIAKRAVRRMVRRDAGDNGAAETREDGIWDGMNGESNPCPMPEILYIGDSLEDDVIPGLAAGFRVIWLNKKGEHLPKKAGGSDPEGVLPVQVHDREELLGVLEEYFMQENDMNVAKKMREKGASDGSGNKVCDSGDCAAVGCAAGDCDTGERYTAAEEYLNAIPKFVKKNTPEDTAAFWEFLGRPCASIPVIHVAGTNGKGSVCAYLTSVLGEAGYKVGTFISPHLVTTRERIRMDGEPVGEERFLSSFERMRQALESYHSTCPQKKDYHPSYFEYLYFMGLLTFEELMPDAVILETGLGGRLDATNSFPSPAVSVITRIGLDHIEYLGDTPEKIAAEKAGILKKDVPGIYLDHDPSLSGVIQETAQRIGAKVYPVSVSDIDLRKVRGNCIDFSYDSRYYNYDTFTLHTCALFQVENASLAIRTAALLAEKGVLKVSEEQLKSGLFKSFWEGRMEEIRPGVFLDGAHNGDGIRAFLESVAACPCSGKRILCFSVVADKDFECMRDEICRNELFELVALAPLHTSRSLDRSRLEQLFEGVPARLFDTAEEAFSWSLSQKGPEDMVYAAGSLYLVGQLRALLERST